MQAILRFENVLADLRALQHTSWTRVAAEEGLQFPRLESHVYDLPPQRAIVQVPRRPHSLVTRHARQHAPAQNPADMDISASLSTGRMQVLQWTQNQAPVFANMTPCIAISSVLVVRVA